MTRRNTARDYAWMRNDKQQRRPRGSPLICGTRYCYSQGCRCEPCGAANREYLTVYKREHGDYRMTRRELPLEERQSMIEDSIERMKRLFPWGVIPVEIFEWDADAPPASRYNQF